jgi:hypothetical protein
MSNPPTVTLNEAAHRFETESGAILNFRRSGQTITFTHTEVPQGNQHKGTGSALVHAALDHARQHSLKVIPLCPFVSAYMQRHKETLDLLDPSYNKG